jgi:hypothetical protein
LVSPPNEEVANQNRPAFTGEIMPFVHSEFKPIPSLFFGIHHKAFGVQNGVHLLIVCHHVAGGSKVPIKYEKHGNFWQFQFESYG